MPSDTGRRERIVRGYVHPEEPQDQGSDTGRFAVVERPAYFPVERPLCAQHSGVCAEIGHLQEDIRQAQTDIRTMQDKVRKLELLPWRVVAAAVGGGGGVAGVIELLRTLFGA
jgi:hypothetical protein